MHNNLPLDPAFAVRCVQLRRLPLLLCIRARLQPCQYGALEEGFSP